MFLKFMDYFNYAISTGENVEENLKGTCSEDCGSGEWSEMCCASIEMWENDSTEVSYVRTCMDTVIADNKLGLWIDDFYAEISCSHDNFGKSSKSSAKSLAVGAVASLMAALSMY